jgi:hypothetical protein
MLMGVEAMRLLAHQEPLPSCLSFLTLAPRQLFNAMRVGELGVTAATIVKELPRRLFMFNHACFSLHGVLVRRPRHNPSRRRCRYAHARGCAISPRRNRRARARPALLGFSCRSLILWPQSLIDRRGALSRIMLAGQSLLDCHSRKLRPVISVSPTTGPVGQRSGEALVRRSFESGKNRREQHHESDASPNRNLDLVLGIGLHGFVHCLAAD